MQFIKDLQKWDRRFIGLAKHFASWSKDPSTQVGCAIIGPERDVRASGFNGFPRGVADDERLNNREEKYPIIVHAEENAVAHAARNGVRIEGCTAYTTFPPCSKCARLLIQAGISECVWPEQDLPERWKEDMERSKNLLKEAGLILRCIQEE